MLGLASWDIFLIMQVVCIALRQEIQSFSRNKQTNKTLRSLDSFHSMNIKDLVLPSPINNHPYLKCKICSVCCKPVTCYSSSTMISLLNTKCTKFSNSNIYFWSLKSSHVCRNSMMDQKPEMMSFFFFYAACFSNGMILEQGKI